MDSSQCFPAVPLEVIGLVGLPKNSLREEGARCPILTTQFVFPVSGLEAVLISGAQSC